MTLTSTISASQLLIEKQIKIKIVETFTVTYTYVTMLRMDSKTSQKLLIVL